MTENKLIFSHSFENGALVEFLEEDALKIGDLTISYYHAQECCENVYADFSIFKYYIEEINKAKVKKIEIKAVEEIGFVVFFYPDYGTRIGVLVCCYDEQNGYYSNDLDLIISEGEKETRIDISQVTYSDHGY